MTINEAIAQCDNLKPNQYEEATKIQWLSALDGTIQKELYDLHEDGPAAPFMGYGSNTLMDTELLVPEPYSDLYIKYLTAQIDLHNAELARYNNSSTLFNIAYMAYADYYKRTHLPRQESRITL